MSPAPRGFTPEQVAQIGRACEQFAKALTQTFERLAPVMRKLHEGMWDAYRKAGTPYGDSEEGLLQWCEHLGQARRREYEREREQAMQDFARLGAERRRESRTGALGSDV